MIDAVSESIRVLHVDDEPEFAETGGAFLERADDRFDVETAHSADEGLDRLASAGFDCIVSDYEMPGRDGIEFLESVRERHSDLPFILFTGRGSENIASDAISAGVTDYLQKRTGTEQYELLANRIANAVGAHRSRRMLTERTRRLETLISNLPGMVYRCRNARGWPMDVVEGEVEALTGYAGAVIERNEAEWGDDVVHPDNCETVWATVQEALVDDLLTLAREGEAVEGLEPVDLGTVVENCWGSVETTDATLTVDVEGAVRADPGRFKQLVENLYRNAVEHGSTSPHSSSTREDAVEHGSTSPGSQARQDAVEHAGDAVTVTVGELDDGFYVADDGPGIPPDEREVVFDAGCSTSDHGTGFGLRIVEQVAAAHGRDVRVTESASGGARFEVTGVQFDE